VIRSDNGGEFIASEVVDWLAEIGTVTFQIAPGKPWQNGFCESFNSRLRVEHLNEHEFWSIKHAGVMLERFRVDYNTEHLHSSLGCLPRSSRRCIPWAPRDRVRYDVRTPETLTLRWYQRRGCPTFAFRDMLVERSTSMRKIRPYWPQTNSKAAAFVKILSNEWAYGRAYQNTQERTERLGPFLRYYNLYRPHSGIGGQQSISRVHA